jgi:D-hexose-6-phosphate mutarotase
MWPCEFGVIYSVTLGQRSLDTRVVVRNEGSEPWEFMWLWHTYFRVNVSFTRFLEDCSPTFVRLVY